MSIGSCIGASIRPAIGERFRQLLAYVLSFRVLDFFTCFTSSSTTIADQSGEGNNATLYSGFYASGNGTNASLINADLSGIADGTYKVVVNVRSSTTGTKRIAFDGAQTLTVGTANVWEELETGSIAVTGGAGIFRLDFDGTFYSSCDWSDARVVNVSTGAIVHRYQLSESYDSNLDGYPALDSVAGQHGTHSGAGAGGTGEADILQTAGMDWNRFGQGTPVTDLSAIPAGTDVIYSWRSGITSNCIQARRGGDDVISDFTGVEVNDGTIADWSIAGGGDGNAFVAKLYDLSGHGRDAVQATAANQPQVVSSGAVILKNGLPCIQADGVDDYLVFPNTETITAHSLYVVGSLDATAGNSARLYSHSDTNIDDSRTNLHIPALRNSLTEQIAAYDGAFIGSSSITYDDPFLWSVFHSGSLISPFLNGVAAATSAQTLNFAITRGVLFGRPSAGNVVDSFFWKGTAQEFVIYNSDESSNHLVVAQDISSYYGLTFPNFLIPASDTDPTNGALGSAIVNPRPNSHVFNGFDETCYWEVLDNASLDANNTLAGWIYYDGSDATFFDYSGGGDTVTLKATGGNLVAAGLTTPVYYVGDTSTPMSNTAALGAAGWKYIAVTYADFTPTANLRGYQRNGLHLIYTDTKALAELEQNRTATEGKF